MIKRRAREAGLSEEIGCHTFRATGITAYLENGGTIDKAQAIAAHESPRTTKLYDRRKRMLILSVRILFFPVPEFLSPSFLTTYSKNPLPLVVCLFGHRML
jgi:hypothetical protein